MAEAAVVEVRVPDGSTVSDVVARLWGTALPETENAKALVAICRFAVDAEFVEASEVVGAGQELALIPPVSGG